jgi:predicted ATPase
MPAVETITVRGFKSIAEIDALQLGAINVLIGANGSGKSNFIGLFSFLHAIREGTLQDYVARAGGAEKVLHFGSKETPLLHIEISFRDKVNGYEIDLQPTEADELVPTQERVYSGEGVRTTNVLPIFSGIVREGKEAGISRAVNHSDIGDYVQAQFAQWRVYHLQDTGFSSPMKKTADINDNRYLRPDGSNLASFLYYLRKKHRDSYSLIRKTVQRVAPFFDDFSLEPQRLNEDKIRLEWRHKQSTTYFDASSLSDGTLRFIVLATLFLQPEAHRPSVILVDEPELGLHPAAIVLLASLVKHAAVATQVILSTQSSLLLDNFEPEDVLVADRVDGGTQFTRLDPAKLERWLEDYSLGKLWEKNELGGPAAMSLAQ